MLCAVFKSAVCCDGDGATGVCSLFTCVECGESDLRSNACRQKVWQGSRLSKKSRIFSPRWRVESDVAPSQSGINRILPPKRNTQVFFFFNRLFLEWGEKTGPRLKDWGDVWGTCGGRVAKCCTHVPTCACLSVADVKHVSSTTLFFIFLSSRKNIRVLGREDGKRKKNAPFFGLIFFSLQLFFLNNSKKGYYVKKVRVAVHLERS